jgi:aryl-alcohol dehydrogenase-like predicted oxidoreductase
MMKTISLSNTDLEVSAICMGSVWLGTQQDKRESYQLLDQFVEAGGNFIDTANIYAFWIGDDFPGGESETVLGQWMEDRGNRHDIVMATKLGIPYPGVELGLSAKQIEEECEKSLKRLRTDYIDLYFAHADDRNTTQEETLAAFDRLTKVGKVRHIAASNFTAWRLTEARMISAQNDWAQYCAIQQRHSYLRPKHDISSGLQIWLQPEMVDYCQTHNVAMMAYTPTLSGAYSGRADRPIPQEYETPDTEARMAALHQVAEEIGAKPIQVVLAWILQSGIIPLVGGSTPEQFAENLGSLDVKLTAEQMERLNQASD